jgi:hypothetical protein
MKAMNYKAFLEYLQRITLNYPDIKSAAHVPGRVDSAVDRVPDEFIELLLYVLQGLQSKIHDFCKSGEIIVIVGIQPTISMYGMVEHHEHYCCSLDFYSTSKTAFDAGVSKYTQTKSAIIDFTSGRCYSEKNYADLMESQNTDSAYSVWASTPDYGGIPSVAIDSAWCSIARASNPSKAQSEVKDRYSAGYKWFKERHEMDASNSVTFSKFTYGRYFSDEDKEKPTSTSSSDNILMSELIAPTPHEQGK